MMELLCFEVYLHNNGSAISSWSCVLSVYILPLICLAGFITNTACLVIFGITICRSHSISRRSRREPCSLVPCLIALCLFDTVQLVFSVPLISWPALTQYIMLVSWNQYYFRSIEALQLMIAYTLRIFYPVLMASNYASIWVITLICIQRYTAICRPFGMLRYWFKDGKSFIVVISMVSCGANIIRYFEYSLVHIDDSTVIFPTKLGSSPTYRLLMDGVIYALVIYFIPVIILLILNAQIVRTIHIAHKQVRYLGISQRQSKEFHTAFMVLSVVVLFFLCHTPALINRLWFLSGDPAYLSVPEHPSYILQDASNLLVNLNSAANPLVYFLFTRRCKDLFADIKHSSLGSGTRIEKTLSFKSSCQYHSQLSPDDVYSNKHPDATVSFASGLHPDWHSANEGTQHHLLGRKIRFHKSWNDKNDYEFCEMTDQRNL